jgi:hypothetical protein
MDKDFQMIFIKEVFYKASTQYKGKLTKEEGEQFLLRKKKSFVNFRKNCMQMEANLFLLSYRQWMLQEKTV